MSQRIDESDREANTEESGQGVGMILRDGAEDEPAELEDDEDFTENELDDEDEDKDEPISN